MLYFLTYIYITLLSALNLIAFISTMLLIACGIVGLVQTVGFIDNYRVRAKYETYERLIKEDEAMKVSIKGCKFAFFGVLLCILVPDKEQLALIVGLPTVYNIATSEEAQKIPNNVLEAVNSFLEDTTENKKESK